jgi:chemotaxis protein CheY-P-specific phosphatase CheC
MSEAGIVGSSTASRSTMVASLCDGWRNAESIFCEMFELSVVFGAPEVSEDASLAPQPDTLVVGMSFDGPSRGLAFLSLPRASARRLVAALLGESDEHSDEVLSLIATTVLELGNVVLNSVVAEVGGNLGETYRFSLPELIGVDGIDARLAAASERFLLSGDACVGGDEPVRLSIGLILTDPSREAHG